jgi:hypothetical protein
MMAFRKTRNKDGSSYQYSFTKLMGIYFLEIIFDKKIRERK